MVAHVRDGSVARGRVDHGRRQGTGAWPRREASLARDRGNASSPLTRPQSMPLSQTAVGENGR